MRNLNELKDQIHANAVSKGFWDNNPSDEHCLMLVITELSEAIEADRKGNRFDAKSYGLDFYCRLMDKHGFLKVFEDEIKGTVEEELSDACIRLLDLAGANCIDVEMFSEKDMEGMSEIFGEESFTESIYSIVMSIFEAKYMFCGSIDRVIKQVLFGVINFAKHLEIDIMWHIEQKVKYNQSREYLHGKKY